MEIQGYPQTIIFAVLGVGLCLAVVRPYMGFLLGLLLMTAGHVTMFNQTRTVALGQYFNLTDACMLVAVFAFVFDGGVRRPVRLPQIVVLMFTVLSVAGVQSLCTLGWTAEALRACRWAIEFPLAYFLGANMVTCEDRARKLVGVLLAGVLLAAAQHTCIAANIWRTNSLNMEEYARMRTIGFWAGCMPSAFLIVGALWEKPRDALRRLFFVVAGILCVATLFLNQTRSLWIGTVVAVPFILIFFRMGHMPARFVRIAVVVCVVFVALAWCLQRILPGLDAIEMAADRADKLVNEESHAGTRERAFVAEMGAWMDGTLLFGRGLAFFRAMDNSDDPSRHIAFDHLGYVTYLSQLGLIGLFVYGLRLPLGVLCDAKRLWMRQDSDSLRCLGLLGGASIACLSIVFAASSHFLAMGYEAPGAVYGAVWALSRNKEIKP